MSHAWFSRDTTGTHAWASLTADEGVINGSAQVAASVETDLALVWQLNGSVDSDLNLLWQVNAGSITTYETDLTLSWNVITAAASYVETDLELLYQVQGTVDVVLQFWWQVGEWLDVAGAAAAPRRAIKHPGWQRKQAMDAIARERAMERSIRVALNGEEPPALQVVKPPQRTAAQMAAEMASAERAAVAKRRAVEAGVEAQRARVEIQKLQPELMQRRQQASYRVIESLLRQM